MIGAEAEHMEAKIEYVTLDKIDLDSKNPRLGRSAHEENLSQDEILDRMRDWSLEELATSFLENGFWAHEAVLCIEEKLGREKHLVVIEGNRRIAALKQLKSAYEGQEQSRKWVNIIADQNRPTEIFESVPIIRVKNRSDVDTFLGFRHVTGIKEWAPPEKAQFISKLIDEKFVLPGDYAKNRQQYPCCGEELHCLFDTHSDGGN